MKKILIVILTALIFLSSCSMNNDVPTKGELLITINSSLSRSITSGESISANVAKYKIYVFDKEYSAPYITEYLDKNEENQSIKLELQSGDNWVRVYALNELGDSIATDIQKITIQPGKLTNLNFSLTEANIEGSITINIQVPSDKFLYAKIFKIGDKNSLIDTDITATLKENQNFIQITNSEIKIEKLNGGFYSVRFYSSEKTESYISSIPVRVIGSNSYVAGTYNGEKIDYRPYVNVHFDSSQIESISSIYLTVDSYSEITDCTLYYGESESIKGEINKVDNSGTNKSYSIVFNGFDTSESYKENSIPMKLTYTVNNESYDYSLGSVYVKPSAPFKFNYLYDEKDPVDQDNPEQKIPSYARGSSVYIGVRKDNTSYNWENLFNFRWFIDDKEYYFANVPYISIDTSKLNIGEHTLKLVATNTKNNIQKESTLKFKLTEDLNLDKVYVDIDKGKFNISSYCVTPVMVYLVNPDDKGSDALKLGRADYGMNEGFAIPKGFKRDINYILKIVPIINDEEQEGKSITKDSNLGNIRLWDLISYEMSVPKKGVFTNDDDNLPVITIKGLEYLDMSHYELRLYDQAHNNHENITNQLNGNQIQLSVEQVTKYCSDKGVNYIYISLYDTTENYHDNIERLYYYIYQENGLPSINMDKIYQAYVIDQVNNVAKAEYRTLMLNETDHTYLYFAASISDTQEPYLELGSGEYTLNENNIFTINTVKVANKVTPTVGKEVSYSDNICKIDGIDYKLLSSDIDVPNKEKPLEGAWKVNDIKVPSSLLNEIAAKYQSAFKLPENYIKFNDNDFVKVDVIASIIENQFKLAISLNLDADVFESISLADNFTPYIVLEGEIIDNKILKIGDVNVPISLSTTKDGKVLNIFYYLYYLKDCPLSISMVRTDAFKIPNSSDSKQGFESEKKLDFESLYGFANTIASCFPNSDEILAQFDMPVILYDKDGNPMPINNSWEIKSENITSLNNCMFTSVMGVVFLNNNDGKYLMGVPSNYSSANNNQIRFAVASQDKNNHESYVLQINQIIEKYNDRIILDVSYFAESSSKIENGIIVLEQTTNNLLDTINNCFTNNLPIDSCEVIFKTNGEIDFVLTGLSNLSITIGKYSIGNNMIDISIDSSILSLLDIDTKNIKVSAGLILPLENDEIMLLEDIQNNLNFGFKLK